MVRRSVVVFPEPGEDITLIINFPCFLNSSRILSAVTEHAKIYIETLEAITYCEDCKGQYRTIDYGKTCPYCHSEHTYLLKGNEFNIKEIGIYEDRGT